MRKLLAAAACTMSVTAAPAYAAVVMSVTQTGNDVVVVANGTLDLTGTSKLSYNTSSPIVNASLSYLRTGPSGTGNANYYSGLTGPSNFGSGGQKTSTSASGDVFGILGSLQYVVVPTNFGSGGAISSSATYRNATFASMGLSTGDYVFNLPNDTITVQIGSAVPEPATWAMMLIGFGAIGGAMRRRNTNARIQFA